MATKPRRQTPSWRTSYTELQSLPKSSNWKEPKVGHTFQRPPRLLDPTGKVYSKMKSKQSLKYIKAENKSKDTSMLRQHHHPQVYTKWSEDLKSSTSIQSRVCKSLKSLSGIRARYGHLKLSSTWVIFIPLLAKWMEGKSRAKEKEEQVMWSTNTTNKHRQ